jgi:hypothetical protein
VHQEQQRRRHASGLSQPRVHESEDHAFYMKH